MPLERDESPRLTPSQRDAVLDLATRLQAEHDGTIAVDDLASAAAEAGIEPRFVREAASRLSRKAAPSPTYPITPFVFLTVQAVWAMSRERYWAARGSATFGLPEYAVLLLTVSLLAWWATRGGAARRHVVGAVGTVWLAVGMGAWLYERLAMGSTHWVLTSALTLGLMQTFAAYLGSVLATERVGTTSPPGAYP